MGKRSKSDNTANEGLVVESKRVKNKKTKSECSSANKEYKPEESINTTSEENKQVKKKKKSKTQTNKGSDIKKNKKIIFKDDDDEPVEVDNDDNPLIQRKRAHQEESYQENEEDIKDEDIDKFCDDLNEEDNEQYESWVKLLEAKLNSNKKKPK